MHIPGDCLNLYPVVCAQERKLHNSEITCILLVFSTKLKMYILELFKNSLYGVLLLEQITEFIFALSSYMPLLIKKLSVNCSFHLYYHLNNAQESDNKM